MKTKHNTQAPTNLAQKALIGLFGIISLTIMLAFSSVKAQNNSQIQTLTVFPSSPTVTPVVIVIQGELILITNIPPSPTITQTPPPTLTNTPTPTVTPSPTITKTPTPTIVVQSPISTFASSGFGVALSILVGLVVLTLIVLLVQGVSIPDLWSRYVSHKHNTSSPLAAQEEASTTIIRLGEQFNQEAWVAREEFQQIEKYIQSIESGNIALAGPRGIGKTTLQQALLLNRPFKDFITLGIATPTKYDEKEFVLNLFEGLCESVLSRIKKDASLITVRFPKSNYSNSGMTRSEQLRPTILLIGIAALVLLTQVFPTFLDILNQGGSFTVSTIATTFLLLLVIIAFMVFTAPVYKLSLDEAIRQNNPDLYHFYVESKRRLERIGYQQTVQSSSTAEISLSDLLKIGSSFGRSLTRQPYTLVGLIADYREYTEAVAKHFGKAIICIDELDKVLEANQAREFLRKIKGVFSISNTYYLVSVSEEALEAFQLRNILGKDEVDSTFTTVYRLHPLTISESKDMLQKRGVENSAIETVLSVLSAGVPRDLVRLARKIHLSDEQSQFNRRIVVEKAISETIHEVVENVRASQNFSYDAKSLIGNMKNLLTSSDPLQLGELIQSKITQLTYGFQGTKLTELSNILLRLGVRLEIMGFLATNSSIFDDVQLSSEFQQALALVPISPYEAQRLFYKLQQIISNTQIDTLTQ